MTDKAAASAADEVVLDLEDAVAAAAKDAARSTVLAALEEVDWGNRAVAVRVNAIGGPWCHQDVVALAGARVRPRSIVVPKVESAADVAFVERLLAGAEAAADGGRRAVAETGAGQGSAAGSVGVERAADNGAQLGGATPRPIAIQALVETAAGLARVDEIAAASPRLEALILGYADLAASLGRTPAGAGDLLAWDAARERVLVAARTHGLQAIDGPSLTVAVDDAFTAATARARKLGWDGRWAIHPAQLEALVTAFTPDADELAWARSVLDALASAERDEARGAVAVDGQMVDEAVRVAALRTLARAGG
jgi:citrate lyase subunit beta/citryl-CoA lyase